MRRAPLRRVAFKRKQRVEGPTRQKEAKPLAVTGMPATVKPLRVGTYGPAVLVAEAKPQTYRDPVLLEMARGRRCLLRAVEHCHTLNGDTTVACHENENKGMGLKASDARSVWGCAACHEWFDRSGAFRMQKRKAFAAAHERQMNAWWQIANNPSEPERFRRAAQRALNELEATDVPL